ncbi:arylsulfatase [Anaerosinus massiliensis]|uniref:arylsulfatase n=1 Tax=Massilibacillus massiliensis TaxID=1806837 RepID=UPI000A59679C|nr:arylsulfatase [Massilibacillus massiliensis]
MNSNKGSRVFLGLSAVSLSVAMTANLYTATAFASAAEQSTAVNVKNKAESSRPNVIFIVLDDMGFADFGSYGSEIKTPNIDQLAADGLLYNNFNTCPVCSPTRASLLTGRDNHAVGMGSLASVDLGPKNPNMRARINHNAATVAQVLQANGYSTMAVGKWHLAPIPQATPAGPFEYWPLGKGFERFYGYLGGETDQFDPVLIYDNHAIETPKEEGYQFSADMTDKALQFLTDQVSVNPDKPFFLYYAPGAVHSPHQAPQQYIDMYQGVYDKGWDAIRQARFEKQKAMGIIPKDAKLSPADPTVKAWDRLSKDEKQLFARFEQAYAGFLTYADVQIGRLVDALKKTGQYDNTMIVVISDNGATGNGEQNGTDYDLKAFRGIQPSVKELLPLKDKIGGPSVAAIYPKGWAMASNTPFQGYKFGLHNGGVREPLIVHWPAGIQAKNEKRSQFVHVSDITPTVYDIAGVEAPATYHGIAQLPLDGKSIKATFADADAPSLHGVQYYLFAGNRAIFKDGWKAVATHKKGTPFTQDVWQLYDLNKDYAETQDLAAQYPEKLKELQVLWSAEAQKHGAILKENENTPTTVQRDAYIYYAGVNQMSSGAGPAIYNTSYTITVPIERKNESQDGVLVSLGNAKTGYALYVKNNRLVYQHNYFGKVTRIVSDLPVPEGKVQVQYVFTKTGPFTGRGELRINGISVGEKQIEKTFGQSSDETFDIGCDRHGLVGSDYQKSKDDFRFKGTYQYVRFDIKRAAK